MGKNYAPKNQDDFILGGKAADLWLRTADMCANKKVIPVRYRYTTGTGMMQSAEAICGAIEEANLIDLERDDPRKRLALQRGALRECRKMERRIQRMLESKQYPGINVHRAATWSKDVLTVRYMCAPGTRRTRKGWQKSKRIPEGKPPRPGSLICLWAGKTFLY